MFSNIENLKIVEIHKGLSKKDAVIESRKNTSFVLRTSGHVRYTFEDYAIDVFAGDIIFMPKGSSYTFQIIGDEASEYVSVKFEADLEDMNPSAYSMGNFEDNEELTNNLVDLWKFGSKSEQYRCYSVFYNLLSYIENFENMNYADKKKIEVIDPAVSYLKKHIYDCDLNIESLPKLCGISGAYFRKIFALNFGTSPHKYILRKRLSHAKSIIGSGDFDTISEVAIAVGYNDPLYFSRAFKKKYGVSPMQYAKGI